MSEKKLPKGAQSLGDIARMRGKGWSVLRRHHQETLEPSPAPHTPRGERVDIRLKRIFNLGRHFAGIIPQAEAASRLVRMPSPVSPRKIHDISSIHPDRHGDLLGASSLRSAAKRLGAIGSKAGKVAPVVSLPSQYEEYKEMMKPLHKREQERSAKRM